MRRVPSLCLDDLGRGAARKKFTSTETCGIQLGHLPYVNVPGYTGFIPGKAAESVLGASHTRANALSLLACSRRGVPEVGQPETESGRNR